MFLFLSIIAISFLLTIITDVVKFLGISTLFMRGKSKPSQNLQDALKKAEAEQERLINPSLIDDYSYTIRSMRAKQKVQDARYKIEMERVVIDLKKYSVQLVTGYVCKAILYLCLVVISIRNRYNPVLVLGDEINLQPLSGLLSFPTGMPNAISVPIWILSCNVTFGLFSGLIKEKKTPQK